ncbi:NifB/NifX family molybdenum-iron cluster-binding protein [Reinekea marinisedimentorum]|uniref:Putative Fe-Mo cluster-binding NifX family protein n=1 Tax=Reinekea marinisedimentorum TaxID=230495 RepID=A0A4R3I5V4_9GAMM|nr:NifB/NifX family molybdenum-iron cluster-binding protein [Reinekea marinisedimentorum]TCS40369.1 putative Fe-Mo cluster-binding NifX family protein [Reinekea marinisedimentorum]
MPIREKRKLNRSGRPGRGEGRCESEPQQDMRRGAGDRGKGFGPGRRQAAIPVSPVNQVTQVKIEKPFMKIAISTTENSSDALMDERFGRAPGFLLFDTGTSKNEFINNQTNVAARQSAGIQSAQALVNKGVEAVISGHCGPKAFRVLNDAGVKVFMSAPVKVSEAVSRLQAGELEQQLS